MYKLGKKSQERLSGVHPSMVRLLETAIELSSQDFTVLEGVRTIRRDTASSISLTEISRTSVSNTGAANANPITASSIFIGNFDNA